MQQSKRFLAAQNILIHSLLPLFNQNSPHTPRTVVVLPLRWCASYLPSQHDTHSTTATKEKHYDNRPPTGTCTIPCFSFKDDAMAVGIAIACFGSRRSEVRAALSSVVGSLPILSCQLDFHRRQMTGYLGRGEALTVLFLQTVWGSGDTNECFGWISHGTTI